MNYNRKCSASLLFLRRKERKINTDIIILMEDKQLLEWINVFKVNRKIKSRLWPWIKIILSIVLFFAVFYGDIYVHILDGTNMGRIVEAMILVVFSFLDYLICFISVAEMDCLKDRRYAAAKESGEFYTISQIESSLFNYVPRTYTIYYRRGSRRLTFGVRTRTTGNPLEMGGREYFIGPTGKREQIVKDLETLMKEVKKYARFDKVLVQTINGEPVKR